MERPSGNLVPVHSHVMQNISNPYYPTYRPVLPGRVQRFYSVSPQQRRLQERTQCYVRALCMGLLALAVVLALALSPLHWVRFVLQTEKRKLLTGLWNSCEGDNPCWEGKPKVPYYLQLARAFFLLSALAVINAIAWFCFSLSKEPRDKAYIDLCICTSSFAAGIFLILCLVFFMLQVKHHSKRVAEPHFLLPYRLHWWGCVLYIVIGFICSLNYLSTRFSATNQSILLMPVSRMRTGDYSLAELGTTWCSDPTSQTRVMIQTATHRDTTTQTEADVQAQPKPLVEPETPRPLEPLEKPEPPRPPETQERLRPLEPPVEPRPPRPQGRPEGSERPRPLELPVEPEPPRPAGPLLEPQPPRPAGPLLEPQPPRPLGTHEEPEPPKSLELLMDPKRPKPLKTQERPEPPRPLETQEEPEPPRSLELLMDAEPPKPLKTQERPEPPRPLETQEEPEPPKSLELLMDPEPPKPLKTQERPEPPIPLAIQSRSEPLRVSKAPPKPKPPAVSMCPSEH